MDDTNETKKGSARRSFFMDREYIEIKDKAEALELAASVIFDGDGDVLLLTWKMLETIRLFDPREKGIWKRTTQVACILTSIKKDDPIFNAETVKKTVELIVATDQCHLAEADRGKVNVYRHMIIHVQFHRGGRQQLATLVPTGSS